MLKAAWLSVGIAILALLSFARTPAVIEAGVTPQTSAYGGATGEITGKALFEGARPKLAEIHMDQDPVCVAKHVEPVHVEDGEVNGNGTLPSVFVYVKAGAEKYNFPVPAKPVILDQHACVYEPHVLGTMAGQELRVVSSDATTHNIHPMPKENREWNQSQPPGAPPLIKRFTHPEIMIPVKCNQHPWMRAYIGVVANPFYAVTGGEGAFTLKGLPPGEYVLGAWTATFGAQEQRVVVRANESTEADFTFRAP